MSLKVKASALSQTLRLSLFEAHGIPLPVPEFRFCEGRRFRFDYAWLHDSLALEIQGGIFTGGRHVRGAALLKEHEKLNEAAIAGWRILFCTPDDFNNGKVFPLIRRALGLPERSP